MKLRTATPVSFRRVVLPLMAVLVIFGAVGFAVLRNNAPASADQYDDKIRALQADMERYQQEADRLNGQAVTLKNTIAQLDNEKRALQAQIDLSQAEYNRLTIQIKETEQKIAENQDALGVTIADLYVDDTISPVEMLASSTNLSDFLDKQEYRNSIRDNLATTIKEVRDLKAQLTEKKKKVEVVLKEQKDARAILVGKQNEQSQLLAQTQSNEAEYQSLIADNKAEIEEARAVQAAIRARIENGGGGSLIQVGTLADYPWNSSNCPMIGYLSTGGANGSGGDGRGYGCRQCASYAAWKVAKETGYYPVSWGNATNFPANARAAGYSTGSTPRGGSLGVMHAAKAGQMYGHVVWVETDPYINGAGQRVMQISQYNYNYGQGYGLYSYMEIPVSAFDEYIYIK